MSIRNDLLEKILNGITQGGTDVDTAYCAYEIDTPLALTTTLTKATSFTEAITPQSITESNGTFTANFDGVASLIVERLYTNGDITPGAGVNVTIELRRNGVAEFTRTSPMPAATLLGGDGVLPITTPFLIPVTDGDTFEFYFSGEDGGSDPNSTSLAALKFTADNAHNKPAV